MAVTNHGIEALRKSANQVTPGDDREYYLATKVIDLITGAFKLSGLNIEGKVQEVVLNSTKWVELTPTPLAQRNQINIQNESGQLIKLRYDATGGFIGVHIKDGVERQYTIQGDIKLYGRCETGTATIVVEELA